MLPEDLRDSERVLDKKGIKQLYTDLAEQHPEKYVDVNYKLHNIAHEVATQHGGVASFSLDSMRTPDSIRKIHAKMQGQIDKIMDGPGSTQEKNHQVVKLIADQIDPITKLNYEEGLKENNPFAYQVLSGSRGNASQFRSLRGGDLLVSDHNNNPIPVPIFSSFSEGLDPAQFWASTYGARQGEVVKKFCVAADTLVLLADGTVKPIKDVQVGDLVLGSDLCGVTRAVKVLNVIDCGVKPCFEYRFRVCNTKDVATLTATKDHEILSKLKLGHTIAQSWYSPRKAKLAATRKDFFAVPPQGYQDVYGTHVPYALLAGLLLGDGCLRGTQIYFSCNDPKLIEDFDAYLLPLNQHCIKVSAKYLYTIRELVRTKFAWNPVTRSVSTANPLRLWLQSEHMMGKLAHEKRLPDTIWTWDNESICQLIAGLYSTDGCINKTVKGRPTIALGMTAEHVIRETKRLLELRFGISTSSVRTTKVGAIKGLKHDMFAINVSRAESLRRFQRLIPLIGVKKETLARRMEENAAYTQESDIAYAYDNKRYIGERRTFDLTVDHPDHLFVLANGLIVANSSPESGFLGKQLAMATHRLIVTEADCGTGNGIPVSAFDKDNEGAVLAQSAGGVKSGTPLTPKHLRELGEQNVLVRSPITCQSHHGVCQKCAGIRESGSFPKLGENIGISAAQALSEPLTNATMKQRHTGGQYEAKKKVDNKTGLDLINQIVEVPRTFHGGAAIAQTDGRVDAIEAAPQGGQYITIQGMQHWVPPDVGVNVAKGDTVDAGDVLSEGLPNPAEIVKHKGIGEGRRYFTEIFKKAMDSEKFGAHRRNVELLARGLVNHVRITDRDGPADTVPDDVVEYDHMIRGYQPRFGHQTMAPKQAVGLYLESPVLHYSVGTRVSPKVAKQLETYKVPAVTVHADPPSFEPEMTRAMETLSHSDDWMVRLGGFHLKKGLIESVHRARKSDTHGTSFIPALAQGSEFGKVPPGAGY